MGERIKYLREKNNMTQDELGELLGVQKSAIAKYENGKVENIKRSTIKKMADIFNISACYLMGFDEDEDNVKKLHKQTIIFQDVQDQWGKETAEALYIITKLNEDGIKKAISTIDILLEIPKYRKDDDS